jgi:hypothetical protein
MQACRSHDIDFAQQQSSSSCPRDEIEQRAFRLHVDQQLEIALRPLIATRGRTEQADVSRSVSCCDVSDLISFVLDIHGCSADL